MLIYQVTDGYSATHGRLATVVGGGDVSSPQTFSYGYTPNSNLLQPVTGPAHTVTNTWEATRDVLATKENKVGTDVVSNYDYAVNAIGQRTAVATSGTAFPAIPRWAWGYDSLGQVTTADSNIATRDRAYEYDAIGNRKKSADNLTLPAGDNYTANALNQYSNIQPPEGSTGVSPVLKKTRLWGTDLSETLQGAGGVGGLLSETINNQPSTLNYFPTYDGNGNVSEYLTATGTTAAHFKYDPFGNTVVNTDTSNQFAYRFSTKPADFVTGLYYYGYRYYDPLTGRWPSRDPVEEKGGLNLYGLGPNNPINGYDILGLKVCTKVRIDKTIFDKEFDFGKVAGKLKVQMRGTLSICDNGEKTLTGEIVGVVGGKFPLPVAVLTGTWTVEAHGKGNFRWCNGFLGGDAEAELVVWVGVEASSGIASVTGEIGGSASWDIKVNGNTDYLSLDATGKGVWLNGRIKAKVEFGWVDYTREIIKVSGEVGKAPDWSIKWYLNAVGGG